MARSVPHLLAVLTARLGIGLLLVWLARTVVVRLPFTRGFNLSNAPLSSVEIINSIAYLIALGLLLHYARVLRALWPQVFPRRAPFASALTAIVYLGALVAAYFALERPVNVFAAETGLLLLQAIAFVLAVILVMRAGLISYQYLPLWVAGMRFDALTNPADEIACLNCGRLNPAVMTFCGHCGKPLAQPSGSTQT
jgi:hypothetical protein